MLRERAEAAGLTAAMLAAAMRLAPSSVYRGLDRDAPELGAVIAAWELMMPDQRRAWLAALAVPRQKKRGRPRKISSLL